MRTNRAAIDIGTNSIHLLVAAVGDDGEFTVLTTDKETVRLGESRGDIRSLSDAAIDRGVAALQRFRAIADSFEAAVDAVATSAVREADNGHVFVERAATEAGITVDVISGPEEARLIHAGVLQALPVFDQQILVIDIGGGSTEMLIGRSGRSLGVRSLKIGHLRLTNRFFPEGVITGDAVDECHRHVRSFIAPAVSALRPLGFQTAIGSSGTAEALGDLVRRRTRGDVGNPGLDTVITAKGLRRVLEELVAWDEPVTRAANITGLNERRADVIVAGAILLKEIFDGFGIERMITSPYALREGVLLDRTLGVIGGHVRLADLRRESLMKMVEEFEEDQPHVLHGTELALQLFDELSSIHGLSPNDAELLEAGGLLANIGLLVSHAAHHQHSEYIIRNTDRLAGYTEREIEVISQIARYHRRSAPKKSHPNFQKLSDVDRNRVRWMAGMLRIAIALDRTRQSAITTIAARADDEVLVLECSVATGVDASVEQYTAMNRTGLLEAVSGRRVVIEVVDA